VLTHDVGAVQIAALVVGCLVVGIALRYDRPVTAVCIALALVLVFAVDQWEVWYPVLFVPLLVVPRARAAQVAVTLVFLEAMIYLGGFPDALRFVHLYVNAMR
jgi:hypothetical protein